MKGIDMSCASQASTAICLAMDATYSSPSAQLGGRAIDRHNPIIRDGRRVMPCSSQQPPINPKPYNQLHKSRKSSSKKKKGSSDAKPSVDQKKKSAAEIEEKGVIVVNKNIASTRKSSVRQSDLFSPPGSTRYLLSDDAPFSDGFSDYDPVLSLPQALGNQDSSHVSPQSESSSDQVVELRVSLHCKGCEGKVRKHLSRMKGVTSFKIDYAAKKVMVTGNMSPASVLASVSKVKSAQFWTSPNSVPCSKVESKK